jgi:hypothetical protein
MNEMPDWQDGLPELPPGFAARVISRAKEQKRLEMQGRRIVKRAGTIFVLLLILLFLVQRGLAQVLMP